MSSDYRTGLYKDTLGHLWIYFHNTHTLLHVGNMHISLRNACRHRISQKYPDTYLRRCMDDIELWDTPFPRQEPKPWAAWRKEGLSSLYPNLRSPSYFRFFIV